MFSLLMAVHNRAALVGAALDSALSQRDADLEIIVVDDGSTDDTPAVLQSYAERVTVLRQDNAGAGAARNRALAAASGEYCCFLDSDDLWFPWTLATYRAAIAAHAQPAFLSSVEQTFTEPAELTGLSEEPLQTTAYADYFAAGSAGQWVPLCGVVVRTEVLRAAGGFAAHRYNYEETDLWLRLGAAAGFVRITAPCCSARRRHDAMATHDRPRSVAGCLHLLEQETRGSYPGGKARRRERLALLSGHVRPVAWRCAAHGARAQAWKLYRQTLALHAALGRWRFLLGLPVRLLMPRGGRRDDQ